MEMALLHQISSLEQLKISGFLKNKNHKNVKLKLLKWTCHSMHRQENYNLPMAKLPANKNMKLMKIMNFKNNWHIIKSKQK